MLQAKTIMIKDVITVRPQDTLDQVIQKLVDNNITGIPVVNEDNTLAGIITEKDILSYMLEQDAISRLTDSNLCEHTVYHAMTADVVAFDNDGEILRAGQRTRLFEIGIDIQGVPKLATHGAQPIVGHQSPLGIIPSQVQG